MGRRVMVRQAVSLLLNGCILATVGFHKLWQQMFSYGDCAGGHWRVERAMLLTGLERKVRWAI